MAFNESTTAYSFNVFHKFLIGRKNLKLYCVCILIYSELKSLLFQCLCYDSVHCKHVLIWSVYAWPVKWNLLKAEIIKNVYLVGKILYKYQALLLHFYTVKPVYSDTCVICSCVIWHWISKYSFEHFLCIIYV